MLDLDLGPGAISFWIHVTPRAKQPGISGHHAGALRVSVAAAPVDGKANAACASALAAATGAKKRDITIHPASKNRRKRVRIVGDPDILAVRLNALAQTPGLG